MRSLHYIDDSEDEVFLSQILFRRQQVAMDIRHFTEFRHFEAHVADVEVDELRSSIIAIDLNLTVSSGIEGIRTLRQLPSGGDLIVGICSGSEDPADRLMAFEAGADFFVGKPLNSDRLVDICDARGCLSLERDSDGTKRVWIEPR